MVARKIGQIVHYEDISRETINSAVAYCLSSDVQQNVQKVSYEYRNRLETPKRTAVWWIEHVIATGGAPLIQSQSTFLSSFVYYSFDVYLTIFVIISGLAIIWVLVLKRILCARKSQLKLKSN